jgi:proteic killer suppression protein
MIRSFKHKGLEQFFRQGSKKGIQPKHATKLRIQLAALENAKYVADVAVPNWRLHSLGGDLKGHFSISVDENWRLTFQFENGDVEVLDYQDYH